MTMATPPLSGLVPSAPKKKRVLLVDTSPAKRDLRAEVMRKLGMDVDCAADITEARCWWRADLYDLVLFNVAKGLGHRDKFCDDIGSATPPQQLAFLVGQPEYLAAVPGLDKETAVLRDDLESVAGDVKAALSADLGELPQRWGILEASRRISSVRAACHARVRARQDRPVPPRDFEGRPARRSSPSITLDELLGEEMQ